MKKGIIIGIAAAAIVLIVAIYFIIPKNSENLQNQSQNNVQNQISQTTDVSDENTLLDSYISCMSGCFSGEHESRCISDSCYPSLRQGLKDLGYNSSAYDTAFTSNLNQGNKDFISCTLTCDYMEEDEMNECLKSCIASRQ